MLVWDGNCHIRDDRFDIAGKVASCNPCKQDIQKRIAPENSITNINASWIKLSFPNRLISGSSTKKQSQTSGLALCVTLCGVATANWGATLCVVTAFEIEPEMIKSYQEDVRIEKWNKRTGWCGTLDTSNSFLLWRSNTLRWVVLTVRRWSCTTSLFELVAHFADSFCRTFINIRLKQRMLGKPLKSFYL